MSIEAMKQALEALRTLHDENMDYLTRNKLGGENNQCMVFARETITTLRQAIEQAQKQEPVVWMYQDKSTHEVRFQKHMRDFVDHSKTSEVPLYGEPLANHELQCVCGAVWCGDEMVHLPNKAPPRKPLTDEEIGRIAGETLDPWSCARAIEAAHGIKE